MAQTPIPTSNPIQIENALTGTLNWQIPRKYGAFNHELEGYASHTSVNVGEQIRFHLNVSTTQHVNIDIYRLGYYNGLGGRLVHSTQVVNVIPKSFPIPNSTTGLAECDWLSPATAFWDVPTTAVSGVYLAKLSTPNGYQSYISFVVRDDARQSDLLFQRSVTTDQAYNNYPGLVDTTVQPCSETDPTCPSPSNGKSLYAFNSYGTILPGPFSRRQQARKVSFNRPYGVLSYNNGNGIYQTAGGTLFTYDFQMIRWLEKEGYDVTYCTNIDTHTADATNGRLSAGRHKAFLSVGHDEYWSWEMRDKIEQARNRPTNPLNLGFFTGNAVYWQIRFEHSLNNTQPASAPNRTIVGYKELAINTQLNVGDPFFNDGVPENNHLITNYWRQNQLNQGTIQKPPEDELIGVMWSEDPAYCCTWNEAIITPSSPSWIKLNMTGQQLDALVGFEADRLHPENVYSDRVLQVVGESPYRNKAGISLGNSHMTFYTRNANSARVFATGTIQWSWGLDNYNADPNVGPITRGPYKKADAQILTRNVLGCLINGVCS